MPGAHSSRKARRVRHPAAESRSGYIQPGYPVQRVFQKTARKNEGAFAPSFPTAAPGMRGSHHCRTASGEGRLRNVMKIKGKFAGKVRLAEHLEPYGFSPIALGECRNYRYQRWGAKEMNGRDTLIYRRREAWIKSRECCSFRFEIPSGGRWLRDFCGLLRTTDS
jgi:hypothetical protein